MKSRMRRAAVVTLLFAAGCAAEARGRDERVAVLVATAEAKGTPEPCGCTSDPLGDVARVATLAKDGLLLDAGGLLYDRESAAPEKRAQADAKAKLLASVYARGEVGLGADDLVHGPKAVAPPRQAANLEGIALAPPRVHDVDGVKVGVFGVISAAQFMKPRPLRSDLWFKLPEANARVAVAKLKREGAQVIVALLGMTRGEARNLMREVDGIGFGIFGADVGDGMPEPEPVNGGFLAGPGDLLRYAVRIELHVKNGQVALTPFAGEAAQKLQIDRATRKIAELDGQLAEWKKDPTADKAFVAARQKDRDELAAKREKLQQSPPQPPDASYFTYALVPMKSSIARDPAVEKSLRESARAIGAANFAAARGTPPPPAEDGQPKFVGMGACAKCHQSAVDFWRKTVHAHAWKTLVDVDKQYDYDCIGCHVTGFQKPGGSNLATVEKQQLVDVQCEVCHGPGSQHVAEAGLDDPKTLTRKPADNFCADNCHSKEHSDTFQLAPYLRDVVGPGHGEKLRAQLGAGVTGHELRTRALEAAGRH